MLGARQLAEPWICARCLSRRRISAAERASSTWARQSNSKLRGSTSSQSQSSRSTKVTSSACLLRQYSTPSLRRSANVEATLGSDDPYFQALTASQSSNSGIRKRLLEWQEINGIKNIDTPAPFADAENIDGVSNDSMRLNNVRNGTSGDPADAAEEAREEQVSFKSDDLAGPEYEYLAPGDLVEVEMFGNSSPILGVLTRDFRGRTSQVYTVNGSWLHTSSKAITFVIPKFMDVAMLKDITPYMPKEENISELLKQAHSVDIGIPREIASPALTKLLDFSREVQEVYRKHASVLDSAHQILAHQSDLRFGTLEKIASKLLGQRANNVSGAALVAVRRALVRTQGFDNDARSHRFTRVFLIHPKDYVNNITKAADWIRQWQDVQARKSNDELETEAPQSGITGHYGSAKVERFIQKARDLTQEGRKVRPQTDCAAVAPSLVQHQITAEQDGYRLIKSLKFSESDKILLHFLLTATLSRTFRKHAHNMALAARLVRAVDRSNADASFINSTTFKLLQEIGVLKPYENRTLHDEHILLPNSQRSKPLERLREAINTVDDRATYPDSMRDLRRDWKDLDVYTIDGKEAMNIDDGISVEPVPGQPDQWWLRIHIANPTARISKDHDVARMAAHMTETYYSPDDHHWLMPKWITQKFMSIAPNRPVLTFSARVDKDCNMLEYEIQPGIVRKVQKITPSVLPKLLKQARKEQIRTVITVGNAPEWFSRFEMEDEIPTVSKKQKKDLSTILDLAAARTRFRTSNGGMMLDFPEPYINTTYTLRQNGAMVSQLPVFTEAANFVEGDPAIRLSCEFFDGFTTQSKPGDASSMVMEMMLLAGEIAARWCSDRSIPIMYRGNYEHTSETGSIFTADQYFQTYLKPHTDKSGKIPYHLLNGWMRLVGRSGTSLTPLPHRLSGLDQYAKVTTPLGRYGDMIAHWQIESALREESRTGKSLVGSKREDYLAFTRSELEPVVPRLRAREKLLSRSRQFCEDHWVHQLFYRAFHFNEAELPPTLEAIVHSGQHGRSSVSTLAYSKLYGTIMEVLMPQEAFKSGVEGEFYGRAGDHWEVEIQGVDPIQRTVYCKPLRLLFREPYQLDDLMKSDLSAIAT